jgi:hypothetical protein
MEEQQNAGGSCRARLTIPRHAVEIDGIELHVAGDRPERADLVETLSPLGPSDRSWLDVSSARTASISCPIDFRD